MINEREGKNPFAIRVCFVLKFLLLQSYVRKNIYICLSVSQRAKKEKKRSI